MSRRVHLDANVVLRFLRNDDPQQSPTAAELFRRAQAKDFQLILAPVIVLEVFYVLFKTYGMARADAAMAIRTLFDAGLVSCEDGGIALDTLQLITSNKVSFADAYLAATSARSKEEVVSFDRGLAAFKDVRLFPLNLLSRK